MKKTVWAGIILLILWGCYYSFKKFDFTPHNVGEKIDSLNGVYVFYNGRVNHMNGRNRAVDGYNLGLKYQCVEFVKRYYYEHYNHKMPDSYGNAKDFFDNYVKDGERNTRRDLIQYTNPSKSSPKVGDLLIYSPTTFNTFGHVAIVSKVSQKNIEIIQQNPGPFAKSREIFTLKKQNGNWEIKNSKILGWLRKD